MAADRTEAAGRRRRDPTRPDRGGQIDPIQQRAEHSNGPPTIGHRDHLTRSGALEVRRELGLELAHGDVHVVILYFDVTTSKEGHPQAALLLYRRELAARSSAGDAALPASVRSLAVSGELDLTIDRNAPRQRHDLGDGSWCSLTTGFVRNATDWFEELRGSTAWLQNEVLRYDTYVPERRLGAGLRGDANPLLRQSGLALESTHRVPLTGVGALLYRTGDDFQGLHSDRQMCWLDDTIVAIVVLGQRRPFVFRKRTNTAAFVDRTPAGELDGDLVLMPGEGDLVVMGGACQRDWLHGVPRAAQEGPRISLTWRWTSKRGRPDTNPGYYDGRQFSDRSRQPGTRVRRP